MRKAVTDAHCDSLYQGLCAHPDVSVDTSTILLLAFFWRSCF